MCKALVEQRALAGCLVCCAALLGQQKGRLNRAAHLGSFLPCRRSVAAGVAVVESMSPLMACGAPATLQLSGVVQWELPCGAAGGRPGGSAGEIRGFLAPVVKLAAPTTGRPAAPSVGDV